MLVLQCPRRGQSITNPLYCDSFGRHLPNRESSYNHLVRNKETNVQQKYREQAEFASKEQYHDHRAIENSL